MQADLLTTRGKQQRQIETGAEALMQDVGREEDFLPGGLETRGRADVANAEFRDGLVDRRDLFPGALAIFVLIAVESCPASVLAQEFGGAPEHAHHGGIVGQAERREDLGQGYQPAPFVARQQRDRHGFRAKHGGLVRHLQLEPA